jgi:hypothetical protein
MKTPLWKNTKMCDFSYVSNAQFIVNPITSPEINTDSFEVTSPRLLNLMQRSICG